MIVLQYRIDMLKASFHILSVVGDIHVFCNIGNACGGQAANSGAEVKQRALAGHSYPGVIYPFRHALRIPVSVCCAAQWPALHSVYVTPSKDLHSI